MFSIKKLILKGWNGWFVEAPIQKTKFMTCFHWIIWNRFIQYMTCLTESSPVSAMASSRLLSNFRYWAEDVRRPARWVEFFRRPSNNRAMIWKKNNNQSTFKSFSVTNKCSVGSQTAAACNMGAVVVAHLVRSGRSRFKIGLTQGKMHQIDVNSFDSNLVHFSLFY